MDIGPVPLSSTLGYLPSESSVSGIDQTELDPIVERWKPFREHLAYRNLTSAHQFEVQWNGAHKDANSLEALLLKMAEMGEVEFALRFCKALPSDFDRDCFWLDSFVFWLLKHQRSDDAVELATTLHCTRSLVHIVKFLWDQGDKRAAFQAADRLSPEETFYFEILIDNFCEEELEKKQLKWVVDETILSTAIALAQELKIKSHQQAAYDAVCQQVLRKFESDSVFEWLKQLPADEDSEKQWHHLRYLVSRNKIDEARIIVDDFSDLEHLPEKSLVFQNPTLTYKQCMRAFEALSLVSKKI